LSTAALNVFHHVRPAGRNAFGGSAGLKGNGMAFKADILQRYHWPSHSIVEDLEFSTQLLLDDIIVHYNPEAVVLGEMPAQKEPVTTQRVRWEGGRLQILREYGLELLKKCVHKKRFVYFDGFMEIILPPLTILVSGQLILLFLACLFFQSLIFDAILCLLVSLVYVLSGMILRNAPVSIWLSFVGAPLFIIWKLFLYVTNLPWKDSKQWIRTKRHSEIRKR
jgi:cellulose synthase/poly-beta-1,6-N-acetylglucosamine synthase-like glycosyltransferase